MAGTRSSKRGRGNTSKTTAETRRDGVNAAGPEGVTKTRKTRGTKTPAAPTNHATGNQAAPTAPNNNKRRRRRSLATEVVNHGNLFDLADPELLLRRARASRRPARGPARPARVVPLTPRRAARPAPAGPPAPVARPPQQTQPSLDDDDGAQAAGEPTSREPIPENAPVANDLIPDQEAGKEAAEAEQAVRDSAAAKDRVEKEEAAKRKEAEKRHEAAKKEAAGKQKAAEEKAAKREEAAQEQASQDANVRQKASQESSVERKAAREKADEEKAARDKEAREKVTQDKAAQAKAAQAKANQEKAAAEENATREKAAQEKLRLEEVARENARRVEAAKQEATRKKAVQEKEAQEKAVHEIAAEVKAAQEKEQAEKAKAKAAEDEQEIRFRATYFKKRDDQKAAEMELRQAKERAQRKKEELLQKEAAGFKKPGTKRAAPKPEIDSEGANKKAKVECKESCKRLEEALASTRVNFNHKSNPPVISTKAPGGPVKFGSHLDLDIISQALASVTEAINFNLAGQGKQKLFSLFHPRSMIDQDPLETPVVFNRHDALVPIDRSVGRKSHSSLVVLVRSEVSDLHGRDIFAMHHYDSDPSLRTAFHNTTTKKTTRERIFKTGWASSGKGEVEILLDQSENRTVCDQLAEHEWACGLHAILNGWVCALALDHNINALVSKAGFYEKAVDMINLAIRGLISSQMILDFFDCYEYTEPDKMPEDIRSRRSFKETRTFEAFTKLETYIMRLLGREARRDVDATTGEPNLPPEDKMPILFSPDASKSCTFPPRIVDKYLRRDSGSAGLSREDAAIANPEEGLVDYVDDDSARSDGDDYDEDKFKLDDNKEEPKLQFDFMGRLITAESRAIAKAAAEGKGQQEMERQTSAREPSVELDSSDMNILFDENADLGSLFEEDALDDKPQAPTSAPQEEIVIDDPDTSSSQRKRQPQPDLRPNVADNDEEDFYSGLSPPLQNPPPTASGLNFPGPPPPTPHDATLNGNPFAFPGLALPRPAPQQSSVALTSSQGNNANSTTSPPAPPRQTNSGFRVHSMSSASSVSDSLVLTRQTNPGFTVPSISSSRAGSDAGGVKPTIPPPIVVQNPQGTFTVPSISTASDNSPDGSLTADGKTISKPSSDKQNATNSAKTEPDDADLEEQAWQDGFAGRQSPDLPAAMADYDEPLMETDAHDLEDGFEDVNMEAFEAGRHYTPTPEDYMDDADGEAESEYYGDDDYAEEFSETAYDDK